MSEPQTGNMYQEEPRSFCCRVTTGLKVVGVCEIIWLIFGLVGTGYRAGYLAGYTETISTGDYLKAGISIAFCVFGLFASGRLFYAVDSTAPGSVIPYLVYRCINIPLGILALGFCAYTLSKHAVINDMYEWPYFLFIFAVVVLVLSVVFLAIAHQGRGYLLKKAASMGQSSFINQNYSINKPTVIPADQARPPPYACYPAEEAV